MKKDTMKSKAGMKDHAPRKRVVEKLSREEMAGVQGGTKKKAAKKKSAKKKSAKKKKVGRFNACANANENANVPFCP
jgi:hypothetical protein